MQKVLGCPLIIQITDDEKFFYQRTDKEQEDLEYYSRIADENIKDIIAVGFDAELTFIFKDTEYIGHIYPNVCRLQRAINYNQIKGIFGLNGSENSGKVAYPAFQAAPCLASSFPHIFGNKNEAVSVIPCGIDQDPYFRMTRDIAFKLRFPKPVCLYSKFFPALQGFRSKMSSSDECSAIFLNDSAKQIKDKINKHAFSGGKATIDEHRLLGGDTSVDISFQYLTYFHEDDQLVDEIGRQYRSGLLLSGELKKKAIEVIQEVVSGHQQAKKQITDEIFKSFLRIKPLLIK
jgi:tryptophanyl-tRNA synthetase